VTARPLYIPLYIICVCVCKCVCACGCVMYKGGNLLHTHTHTHVHTHTHTHARTHTQSRHNVHCTRDDADARPKFACRNDRHAHVRACSCPPRPDPLHPLLLQRAAVSLLNGNASSIELFSSFLFQRAAVSPVSLLKFVSFSFQRAAVSLLNGHASSMELY
jgi:hypothetical protein